MKASDADRLKKILRTWEALHGEIEARSISQELLMTDSFTQWAVTTPLYNIGEQVYQISPDLKEKYPTLPWSAVAGMRHRLVHDYEGINWSVLTDVIFEDMPEFAEQVALILRELAEE